MSDPAPPAVAIQVLALTPRQRRLRVITALLLILIVGMVGTGILHPFFRSLAPPEALEKVRQERMAEQQARQSGVPPPPMSPQRRAVTVKLIFLYFYWTLCFLLALSLVVVAWLDLREVRRKLLTARRDLWKETVEEMRQRVKRPSDP